MICNTSVCNKLGDYYFIFARLLPLYLIVYKLQSFKGNPDFRYTLKITFTNRLLYEFLVKFIIVYVIFNVQTYVSLKKNLKIVPSFKKYNDHTAVTNLSLVIMIRNNFLMEYSDPVMEQKKKYVLYTCTHHVHVWPDCTWHVKINVFRSSLVFNVQWTECMFICKSYHIYLCTKV